MDNPNIGYSQDVEELRARKPHTRFNVWRGKDVWNQKFSVQVRLENDGMVFLSTDQGHVNSLQIAKITLEELHEVIRSVIEKHNPKP